MELHQYLKDIERRLGEIRPEKRAGVMLAAKEMVLKELSKNPEKSLSWVLQTLPSPGVWFEHFLNNDPYVKNSFKRPSLLRKFVIGSSIFVLFMVLSVAAVIWWFTPIIEVDSDGRVQLFGGQFTLDSNTQYHYQYRSQGRSHTLPSKRSQRMRYTVSESFDLGDARTVLVKGGRLSATIKTTPGPRVEMNCTSSHDAQISREFQQETLILDLEELGQSSCELLAPKGRQLTVYAHSGDFHLQSLKSNVRLELEVGDVRISPASGARYHYDLRVRNGNVDRFESASSPEFTLEVLLGQGRIRAEN